MTGSAAPMDGAQQAGRPSIVVVGDSEQALQRLGDWHAIQAQANVTIHHLPLQGKALVDALAGADAVVLVRDRTPFDASLLAQLPRLRYLVFTGTRNTTLDLAALAARGIPVSHTEWGPSKDGTCEMTWSLILAATRQLEQQTALLRSGQWRPPIALALAGVLHGQTLGLIGLGEIGGRVARVGQALGMKVVAWSPRMTPERAALHGAAAVSLEELLATSRVVSLHLVPTPATHHLLDAQKLSLMRPDSLLVNTSRSALIDTDALVSALEQGRPGFAALDVFDVEPLPLDAPLRRLPNALLTPHLGFVTEPVFQRFATGVVECLTAWLAGQPLVRVIGEKDKAQGPESIR
ncbi:MAG: D-isomer specific 2-hydroxyacid dehydrogenase, NAD-binding protein [Polaromonas sp.]|nr:D-isomer specific 2-hydroxyacid dehydrogenase, NAD-binding protein [Polaromonas sp.]